MTSDSLPRNASCLHQQEKEKAKCDVTFTLNEVYVVVKRPASVADQWCTSAHRQYLLRMAAYPPTTFKCKVSGKMLCPCMEVILHRAMLEKLPLLLKAFQSTRSTRPTIDELELPCSVWGFVSLLLLLEGSVKMRQWFRGDSDTSLPNQTLLVCLNGYKMQ
jgi:hypothetical protein